MKAPITGGPATTVVSGRSRSTSIAVDGNQVFWIDLGPDNRTQPAGSAGLFRIGQNGTGLTQITGEAAGGIGNGIAFSAEDVFYSVRSGAEPLAQKPGLYQAQKAAAAVAVPTEPWSPALLGPRQYVRNPAVADGYLYAQFGCSIVRSSLSGEAPSTFIESGYDPGACIGNFTVDSTHVYFSTCRSSNNVQACSIERVPVAGGPPEFVGAGYSAVRGIAVDAQALYVRVKPWTTPGVRVADTVLRFAK